MINISKLSSIKCKCENQVTPEGGSDVNIINSQRRRRNVASGWLTSLVTDSVTSQRGCSSQDKQKSNFIGNRMDESKERFAFKCVPERLTLGITRILGECFDAASEL